MNKFITYSLAILGSMLCFSSHAYNYKTHNKSDKTVVVDFDVDTTDQKGKMVGEFTLRPNQSFKSMSPECASTITIYHMINGEKQQLDSQTISGELKTKICENKMDLEIVITENEVMIEGREQGMQAVPNSQYMIPGTNTPAQLNGMPLFFQPKK